MLIELLWLINTGTDGNVKLNVSSMFFKMFYQLSFHLQIKYVSSLVHKCVSIGNLPFCVTTIEG